MGATKLTGPHSAFFKRQFEPFCKEGSLKELDETGKKKGEEYTGLKRGANTFSVGKMGVAVCKKKSRVALTHIRR